MNRREHLRWLGILGAAVVTGCSTSGDSSDGSSSELTLQFADHLAVAVGNLNLVALAIRDLQESSDPRTVTFEESKPRDRLEQANNAVQRAEEKSETADQEDIEAVKSYATILEATVQTVVDLLASSQRLEETKEMLGDIEGELDTAREAISQAKETSTSAVTARETATSEIDSADGDRLEALDAEFSSVRTGVETLSGYVTGVDGVSRGYDEYLGGVADAQQADTEIDNDSFETARDAFESAVTAFQAADTIFGETLAEAPEPLNPELETGQRRSARLRYVSAGNATLLRGRTELETVVAAFEDDILGTDALEDARSSLQTGTETAADARDQFSEASAVQLDEFTEQIETGTARADALELLATGYLSLLDAIGALQDGETALLDEEPTTANEQFQNASTESSAANEEFNTGVTEMELFATEFDTAVTRANTTGSLADGYAALADGFATLRTGRKSLEQRAFDEAITKFQTAADRFETATNTFDSGSSDALAEFDSEFDTAVARANAAGSLATGYGTLADGSKTLRTGRDNLEQGAFDDAIDKFQTAAARFETATNTFDSGNSDTLTEFDSEFERAQCQAGHFTTAADHLESAAGAGKDRNRSQLQTKQEQAQEELDAVENC